MKLKKQITMFSLGGAAYVGLELMWRGRSHPTMFLAGGSCFLLLGMLKKTRLPLPLKPVAGAAAVTAVELVTGLLINRQHHIWDYRDLPLNLFGQICLPYSLLWVPVSAIGLLLHRAFAHAVGEGQ